MRTASHDRSDVLGLAGSRHLSPAVRDGVPVLVPEGDGAGRTGWGDFFAALDRAGLEWSWDTEDEDPGKAIPVAEARPLERHPGLADGVARARRLLAAWQGGPPKAAA
jgi:hypothetical protein